MKEQAEDKRFAISKLEQMNRQDAVDFALASLALEGLTPSPDVQRKARRFVNGEISVGDLSLPTVGAGARST